MTVTFVKPTVNQTIGPGFLWQITFTAIAPSGSHVRGELFSSVAGDTGVGFQTNNIGPQSAAGVIGIVYTGTTPLITTPNPGVAHGQAGTMHLDVINPSNATIDTGDIAITLDFVTGLPYLTSIWPPAGVAGHDPMLDTILAAVQHAYVLPT